MAGLASGVALLQFIVRATAHFAKRCHDRARHLSLVSAGITLNPTRIVENG
jgi:hypothetical protein